MIIVVRRTRRDRVRDALDHPAFSERRPRIRRWFGRPGGRHRRRP